MMPETANHFQKLHAIGVSLNERGGVLLTNDDGAMQAYMPLGDTLIEKCNLWLAVCWRPDDYPSLSINTLGVDSNTLGQWIQKDFGGWMVRKMNISSVVVEDGFVKEVPPPEPWR